MLQSEASSQTTQNPHGARMRLGMKLLCIAGALAAATRLAVDPEWWGIHAIIIVAFMGVAVGAGLLDREESGRMPYQCHFCWRKTAQAPSWSTEREGYFYPSCCLRCTEAGKWAAFPVDAFPGMKAALDAADEKSVERAKKQSRYDEVTCQAPEVTLWISRCQHCGLIWPVESKEDPRFFPHPVAGQEASLCEGSEKVTTNAIIDNRKG
jgi:hypothetical protein